MNVLKLRNLKMEILYEPANTTCNYFRTTIRPLTVFQHSVIDHIRSVRHATVNYGSNIFEYSSECDFGGSFELELDERINKIKFTIPYTDTTKENINIIKNKFAQLYKSDFRYRNENGIEGTLTIYLETFINFLKLEDRDSIIDKILQ